MEKLFCMHKFLDWANIEYKNQMYLWALAQFYEILDTFIEEHYDALSHMTVPCFVRLSETAKKGVLFRALQSCILECAFKGETYTGKEKRLQDKNFNQNIQKLLAAEDLTQVCEKYKNYQNLKKWQRSELFFTQLREYGHLKNGKHKN